MNLEEEYKNHLALYDIPFYKESSCLAYDDSTLFCPAGMQKYKADFLNTSIQNKTVGNIQKCLRLNDLNELGDGTHFGIFQMMGLFSFRHMTVRDTINLWISFLNKISIKIDYVTIHPLMKSWKEYYSPYDIEVREDDECKWTDGNVGGYCTEFFHDNIEIGNIVNPLGTCIDVGFGFDRLNNIVNQPVQKTRLQCLYDICDELIKEGIRPSANKHGYILRKILRDIVIANGIYDHPYFVEEQKRQSMLEDKYKRLKDKYPNKSFEWWKDTHGIDLNLITP